MRRQTQRYRRAQAMVVVFVYLCIVFFVAFSLLNYSQSMHQLVIRSLNHLRGIDAAEAGLVAKFNHMVATYFASGSPDINQINLTFPVNLGAMPFVNPTQTPTCTVAARGVNLGSGNYRVTSTVSDWRAGAPESIILHTRFPTPLTEHDRVFVRGNMFDYDDPSGNYRVYFDGSGRSILNDLRVDGLLLMDPGSDASGEESQIRNTAGDRFIKLNRFAFPSVHIQDLEVDYTLNMGAENALFAVGSGKHVHDIAEGIAARGCRPGDVAQISSSDGALVPCAVAYDARVAGIISESPRLLLGGGEGKSPLALNGIVPCKAVAENGAIKRGDLLVSSSRPGNAMRADPEKIKPGMLVGKAMQPLTGETGTIFVLVNKR